MGLVRVTASLCALVAVSIIAGGCGSSDTKAGESTIRINELQSANKTTVPDELGEFDDWIELYNMGDKDVDLKGYYLSDDSSEIKKFVFTTDAVVKAGQWLVVWADGKDQVTQGSLHAGFKLSASAGDRVILSDPGEYVVDSVEFKIPTGEQYSYARHPDGTGDFGWCSKPTPKAANGMQCE